jgi:hypothetical protein
MADLSFRRDYPLWVRVSVWGSPSRAAVWLWFWASIVLAAVCGVAGAMWDARFYLGLLWLFAALMYWLAIRWVDRHGRW